MKIIKSTQFKKKESNNEIKIELEKLKEQIKNKIEFTENNLNDSYADLKLAHSKIHSELMFLRSDFIILEKKTKRSFLILFILLGFCIGTIINLLIQGV